MNKSCTNILADANIPSPIAHPNHGGEIGSNLVLMMLLTMVMC